MEEKKHLLHYLEQVFVIFGVSILIVEVICRIFGEEARQYSTMFELGNAGVPFHTVLEYLLASVCITVLRFVFFTDVLIRRWSLAARIVGMLSAVTALSGGLSYVFGWFPVSDPKCWAAFFISFGICFVLGTALSAWGERMENRQLEDALQRMQNREGEQR
ncbi:MAG: hypothetical protein NC543_16300 [bacterium]|nr:hypothetical protein [bacterium]MCM1376760.1 hypothetical protein [Muribaculum sp.]